MAQAEDEAGRDGDLYLKFFAVVMMMCGIMIWEISKKVLEHCTRRSEARGLREVIEADEEPRVSAMRLRRPKTKAKAKAQPERRDRGDRPQGSEMGVPCNGGHYDGHPGQLEEPEGEAEQMPRLEEIQHQEMHHGDEVRVQPARALADGNPQGRALPAVGPIITPTGKKFHRTVQCPTLECSRKIRPQMCEECVNRTSYVLASWVYKDAAHVVDVDRDCRGITSWTQPYQECLKCGWGSGLS